MATIYVFNNDTGALESYTRNASDPMPYNVGNTLLVGRFAGNNSICWTDTDFMKAWNRFYSNYRAPVDIITDFQRVPIDDPLADPHIFSGNALFIAPVSRAPIDNMIEAAQQGGMETRERQMGRINGVYISTPYEPSDYFHTSGFPILQRGTNNNYTFMLQNMLGRLGHNTNGLDGRFGAATDAAVRAWQSLAGLPTDGIIGFYEWQAITDYYLY